jgi:hypothetical protein
MTNQTPNRVSLLTAGLIILLSSLGCATAPKPSTPAANPADVGTIADLVRASYEVISGAPRQWDRDRTFYMPGASFVSVWEDHGEVKTKMMTPEEYRVDLETVDAFVESEIGRRIERYGHVAQVRSVAEVRSRPGSLVTDRYVNYFQLYWDGTRWWIAGMVWDQERPGAPIPEAWIGKWEDVTR